MLLARLLATAALALAACSSGGSDDDNDVVDPQQAWERGRDDACHGLCDGERRCGTALPRCDDACIETYQPLAMRAEVLTAIGKCLTKESCETLATDNPSDACVAEVAAAEPLRTEVVAYCESATLAYFQCNSWWELEACAARMGIFEDDVLLRARACHVKPCTELFDCETKVFEPTP
jgi:hypothetical protein